MAAAATPSLTGFFTAVRTVRNVSATPVSTLGRASRSEDFPAFLYTLTRNAALHRCERRTPQKRGGGQIPLAIEELRECAGSGGARTEEDLTIKEA